MCHYKLLPSPCQLLHNPLLSESSAEYSKEADYCCGAVDWDAHTYTYGTHTHTCTQLLWERLGLSNISSNQTTTRQSSAWKFGRGKRPVVRASTLMTFFWVVVKGYGLLFPVFAPSRCVCVCVWVIDGSLIEQRAPIPSLSQLCVPWLSAASPPPAVWKHVECVCVPSCVCLSAFWRKSLI